MKMLFFYEGLFKTKEKHDHFEPNNIACIGEKRTYIYYFGHTSQWNICPTWHLCHYFMTLFLLLPYFLIFLFGTAPIRGRSLFKHLIKKCSPSSMHYGLFIVYCKTANCLQLSLKLTVHSGNNCRVQVSQLSISNFNCFYQSGLKNL